VLAAFAFGCAPKAASPGDRLRAAAEATGWANEGGVTGDGATTTWCRTPDPTIGCSDRRIHAGAGWRELSPARWEAADFPTDGWGGQLTVAGEDWSLHLVRFSGGAETDRLDLGRELSLTLELTDVTAPGGDFSGFTDPRSVGETVCSRLGAVYAAARATLDAGQVQRCHYGHYSGDSSLVCNPVPLPPAEVADWRGALLAEEARHCAQARADGAAIAKLVRGLWPG